MGEEAMVTPAVGARATSSCHPGGGDSHDTSEALMRMGLSPVGWGGPQIEWRTRQWVVVFKLDDEVDQEDQRKLQSGSEAALDLMWKAVALMQNDMIPNAVVRCGFCSFYFFLYFGHSWPWVYIPGCRGVERREISLPVSREALVGVVPSGGSCSRGGRK